MTEQQAEAAFDPKTQNALMVYTDDDGKQHEFDGDLSGLTFQQIWDIQKVTKLGGLQEITEAFARMDAPVMMAILWVNIRAEQPTMKFADLQTARPNQLDVRIVDKAPADPKDSDPTGSPFSTSGDETTSSPSYPSSDTTSESDPAISPI